MLEKLNENNELYASLNVEEYPNTTPDKREAEIEALMLMYATSRKETRIKKRFVDCSLRATYKIKSTLAITIEVIIPTTIAAAINDKNFSFQWRMAIQNELQDKITNEYEFEAVSTQHSRMIVRGMWLFETKANSETNAIDFKASWVNNDSTKTKTMIYTNNIAGINLTKVNETNEDRNATASQIDDLNWRMEIEAGVTNKFDS